MDETGCESRMVQQISSFSKIFIPVLGSTQPHIQWVPAFFTGDKPITHMYLVRRLRMIEAISLLPVCAFRAVIWTILPLP